MKAKPDPLRVFTLALTTSIIGFSVSILLILLGEPPVSYAISAGISLVSLYYAIKNYRRRCRRFDITRLSWYTAKRNRKGKQNGED
jgi:uncharacterized membrane protein